MGRIMYCKIKVKMEFESHRLHQLSYLFYWIFLHNNRAVFKKVRELAVLTLKKPPAFFLRWFLSVSGNLQMIFNSKPQSLCSLIGLQIINQLWWRSKLSSISFVIALFEKDIYKCSNFCLELLWLRFSETPTLHPVILEFSSLATNI